MFIYIISICLCVYTIYIYRRIDFCVVLNQVGIIISLFRMILHQMEFYLVLNPSEKIQFHQYLDLFNKFDKLIDKTHKFIFLCGHTIIAASESRCHRDDAIVHHDHHRCNCTSRSLPTCSVRRNSAAEPIH